MATKSLFFILLLASSSLVAHARPYIDTHDHTHEQPPLPDAWYQDSNHPVHNLFRRAPPADGSTYPTVGSPEWRNGFPPGVPDVNQLPKAWVDALNAAVAAGKIPNIPQSTNTQGTNPQYPQGQDATGSTICSSTYKCRAPGDIWDAPQGMIGTGFDDGPYPPSTKLYQFLQSQNQKATHFMIGTNILLNPTQFTFAFETLQDDIAVHTWTHPYMTTLSNLDVVGQLGWTMQLIHNSTGGRVTKYWRPPYGDADNRVRAIAKEVFGMDTILWNQDTGDWSLGQPGGTNPQAVASNLQKWVTGPKNPGLIILQHELSDAAVQAFINIYPAMKTNNWNLVSVATMGPTGSAYQNANGTGPVTAKGVLISDNGGSAGSAGSTSAAASSAGSSKSSTGASPSQTTRTNGGIANWAGVPSISFSMAVMAAVGLVA